MAMKNNPEKLVTAEEICEMAEIFQNEAIQANAYYCIAEQYRENLLEYSTEMSVSGAFYHYTYNALVVAAIMELAKIYDSHQKSVNIKDLLEACVNNSLLSSGLSDADQEIPLLHEVIAEEEEFFGDEVARHKKIVKLWDRTEPCLVEMTDERYIDLFLWKYSRLKEGIEKLLKQRNKVYAHNDPDGMKNYEKMVMKFPLSGQEVEDMISFACELCRFVIRYITGTVKSVKPVNLKDWENTLQLVREGLHKQ